MINEEGKRLALFLERENMKQKELAPIIKKDEPTITRYIKGQRKVPLAVVKILHLKLGLNYSWFFHGTGPLKHKGVEKRNIMSDLTDIHASIGIVMQSQDSMRELLNTLVRDFYADKHGIKK